MDAVAWEAAIKGALLILEAAANVVPALVQTKAQQSEAFRKLAADVTQSVGEPTDTEKAADAARARLGGG